MIEEKNDNNIKLTNDIENEQPINQNSNLKDINDYKKIQSLNTGRTREKIIKLKSGCSMLLILLLILFLCIGSIIILAVIGNKFIYFIPLPIVTLVVTLFCLCCFIIISPNEACVLSYYGKYIGTAKEPGFFWVRPLTDRKFVSLKSNYYNGNKLKVNDLDGKPVLLGAVVVWRVKDTAKVIFDVIDYKGFVITQTESAIRYIGCKYPYEPKKDNEISLRGGHEIINVELRNELEKRVWQSGIEIEDARITEIEYGKEIAELMLKSQTANSALNAKEKLVKGAVELIDYSLTELEKRNLCKFKEEEKNKYSMNMMMLLSMDNDKKPIVKLTSN